MRCHLSSRIRTIVFMTVAAIVAADAASYQAQVQPFFKAHCVGCHGPEKSKGNITLHTLDGDLSSGNDLEHWETILEMLESGEMPPEDEPQPSAADRKAVAQWIESGLRDYVMQASQQAPATTARRLTNSSMRTPCATCSAFDSS